MKHKRIVSILWAIALTSGNMLSALPVNAEGFSIKGDVNADGELDVADVVLLQKWLLAVPDMHLENWQAADLCKDNMSDETGADICK